MSDSDETSVNLTAGTLAVVRTKETTITQSIIAIVVATGTYADSAVTMMRMTMTMGMTTNAGIDDDGDKS